MGKHYGKDLRKLAMSKLKSGLSKAQIARELNISSRTIYNWERLESEGNLYIVKTPVRPSIKVDRSALLQYVNENPDSVLREIAEIFNCSIHTIHYHLKKLKITRKKNQTLRRA